MTLVSSEQSLICYVFCYQTPKLTFWLDDDYSSSILIACISGISTSCSCLCAFLQNVRCGGRGQATLTFLASIIFVLSDPGRDKANYTYSVHAPTMSSLAGSRKQNKTKKQTRKMINLSAFSYLCKPFSASLSGFLVKFSPAADYGTLTGVGSFYFI